MVLLWAKDTIVVSGDEDGPAANASERLKFASCAVGPTEPEGITVPGSKMLEVSDSITSPALLNIIVIV